MVQHLKKNKKRFSEYGNTQSSEIQFTIRIPDNYDPYKKDSISKGTSPVKIFVKTLSQSMTTFIDVGTENAYKLKQAIEEEIGCSSALQRMFYAEKQLEDQPLLNEYNIQEESIVYLVLRLHGGGSDFIEFGDVSSPGGLRRLTISKDTPKGRMVNSGTNIEVECKCTPSHPVIYVTGYEIT